jgi:16S rRNA (cytidine1402-2'-O)-methyltransferase
MSGQLTLIPTPIGDDIRLHPKTFEMLTAASQDERSIIAVEEHKAGRRRWISFGLPRESIENFELYNEHTYREQVEPFIAKLKSGQNIYLMSDCGLPAFCDPGRQLVERCHDRGIKVTSAPFDSSPLLALALSGFDHHQFFFAGFPPASKEERGGWLQKMSNHRGTLILMDTPYRLKKLMGELAQLMPKRRACLCMDLNKQEESIIRGSFDTITKHVEGMKREFILVIENER